LLGGFLFFFATPLQAHAPLCPLSPCFPLFFLGCVSWWQRHFVLHPLTSRPKQGFARGFRTAPFRAGSPAFTILFGVGRPSFSCFLVLTFLTDLCTSVYFLVMSIGITPFQYLFPILSGPFKRRNNSFPNLRLPGVRLLKGFFFVAPWVSFAHAFFFRLSFSHRNLSCAQRGFRHFRSPPPPWRTHVPPPKKQSRPVPLSETIAGAGVMSLDFPEEALSLFLKGLICGCHFPFH